MILQNTIGKNLFQLKKMQTNENKYRNCPKIYFCFGINWNIFMFPAYIICSEFQFVKCIF